MVNIWLKIPTDYKTKGGDTLCNYINIFQISSIEVAPSATRRCILHMLNGETITILNWSNELIKTIEDKQQEIFHEFKK